MLHKLVNNGIQKSIFPQTNDQISDQWQAFCKLMFERPLILEKQTNPKVIMGVLDPSLENFFLFYLKKKK